MVEKKDMPASINEGEYVFQEILGTGGQGTVCKYKEVSTGKTFAVKFDPDTPQSSNVLTECLFLRDHADQLTKAPQYKHHSTIGGRRFLIMQHLE